jgi:hypothetical protein
MSGAGREAVPTDTEAYILLNNARVFTVSSDGAYESANPFRYLLNTHIVR